jgi:hypothetical protein
MMGHRYHQILTHSSLILRYVSTTDCHACLLWLQSTNEIAMLTSGGKRVSWDIAADAKTNNNPPITSTFGLYVTLAAELADDISLRHIILFFNFIKFTNPNPNPNHQVARGDVVRTSGSRS